MKIEYEVTKNDIKKFGNEIFIKKLLNPKIYLVIFIIIFITNILYIFIQNNNIDLIIIIYRTIFYSLLVIILFLIFYVLFFLILLKKITDKIIKIYHGKKTLEIENNTIKINNNYVDCKFNTDNIYKIIETNNYYNILLSEGYGNIIPKNNIKGDSEDFFYYLNDLIKGK